MPKTTSSQSQHSPFDAFAFDPRAGLDAWQKMTGAYVERLESLHTELGTLQAKGLEQGRALVDEAASVMKASMDYAGRLGDEWRKRTLEATRRTAGTARD